MTLASAFSVALLGMDGFCVEIEADVLSWEPARTWDVWHDRAVLHFLMTDAERDAYRNRLMSALAPEGAL